MTSAKGMMVFCTERLVFIYGTDTVTGRECPSYSPMVANRIEDLSARVSPCWICNRGKMGKAVVRQYNDMVRQRGPAFSVQQKRYLDSLSERGKEFARDDQLELLPDGE